MTIVQNKGSVSVRCDVPNCHMEVLGQTEEDALEDAQLMGWKKMPGDKLACSDCLKGTSPVAARAKAKFGQAQHKIDSSPASYSKGDEVHDPASGDLVGTAAHDVKAGDELTVDLIAPGGNAATGAQPVKQLQAPPTDPDDAPAHGGSTIVTPEGDEVHAPFIAPGPDVEPEPGTAEEKAKSEMLVEEVDDLFSNTTWDPTRKADSN
jgi:hypothetical protein